VYLLDEATRFTPSDGLALSVVGETDTDNVGTAGLEAQFDTLLAGEPGRLVQEESREGHTIPSGQHRVIPARTGANLVLTLDRNLQYTVERELAANVAAVRAKRGVAVVMEPRSGEVMAMASVEAVGAPGGEVRPSAQNLAVTAQFEPGSVLKPVTMAAGIERAGLGENSVLDVPLEVTVGEATFVDEVRSGPEKMTLTDVLARSSNVGTIGVALSVGPEALDDYLHRFRFGTPTGIPLPREEQGSLPARSDW
jgi:cell division protein FtsI (penicillin-binding protein 3)